MTELFHNTSTMSAAERSLYIANLFNVCINSVELTVKYCTNMSVPYKIDRLQMDRY